MKKGQKDDNLYIAVLTVVALSFVTAIATAYICSFVIDSFESSKCMALIISDTGIKSDDANLEHQLSSATLALKTCKDFASALAVGTFACLFAILVRLRKQKA